MSPLIIDWNDLVAECEDAQSDLFESFKTYGCALFTRFPITTTDRLEAAEAQGAVFDLTEDRREQLRPTDGTARTGYIPLMREIANDGCEPDPKEVWHISREPYVQNIWPVEVPKFQTSMQKLWHQASDCATTIMISLGKFLHNQEYMREIMLEQNSVLRSVRYHSTVGGNRSEFLAGEHRDIGLLTVHLYTSHEGYEFKHKESWYPLNLGRDLNLVNSGDMLAHVSNGAIPSLVHRVRNTFSEPAKKRLFMGHFIHPNLTSILKSSTFNGPAQYPDRSSMEVLINRGKEIKIL